MKYATPALIISRVINTGLNTHLNANNVNTILKIQPTNTPNAMRISMPSPSADVIENRCCHSTTLKPKSKKTLASSVINSGRTDLILNMIVCFQ
ncbi:hypothetical protein D3C76_1244660 [compost metagenome]